MSSNYPPGAANDPFAPYNEPEDVEMEVLVEQRLEKTDVVLVRDKYHVWSREDLEEYYKGQHRTALETIRACEKVIEQLVKDGHKWYARTNLTELLQDCKDWEEVEFEVKDGNLIDFV